VTITPESQYTDPKFETVLELTGNDWV
jgi:hypothetical protein